MKQHNAVASVLIDQSTMSLAQLSKFIKSEQTFDDDKAYGKYVTERLLHIKVETVKHDIKLQVGTLIIFLFLYLNHY